MQKFSGSRERQRGSSPKLLVLNTALMSATSTRTSSQAREDSDFWGRLVESAVGAHLAELELFYWRDRNLEGDFVVRRGGRTAAIEVKSGRRRDSLPGMDAFARRYEPDRRLLVGGDGIAVEEFLLAPADQLIG